jgi:cobalamin reductase
VATLSNIHRAMDDKPLVKRMVTVSGAVKNPKSMWLPIGTTIERAIELAGGSSERYYRVIHGGPMMGKVIDDLTAGTTKGTTSILVLPDNHTLIYKKTRTETHNLNIARSTCDQCVLCTIACPRNLLGHELYPHETVRAVISPNTLQHPNITSGYQCCECGICGLYACPMGIFPNALYTKIRKELRENKVSNPHKKAPTEPHEFRDYRKIPTKRLASRLDLDDYTDIPISYDDGDQKVRLVRLSLSAHIGAPAEAVVQLGQRVGVGELVAEIPEGALGARVHASIEGIIKENDGEIIIERG